jgi:outer membrane protein OmpA-like peptidoglycan-associated protein
MAFRKKQLQKTNPFNSFRMNKLFVALLFTLAGTFAHAQTPDNYYVVIGAFRIHDNAIRLTDQANKQNLMADYAMNPRQSLYFVYVLQTPDKARAFSFLIKIKATTAYKDAWVFKGVLGQLAVSETPKTQPEPVVVSPVQEPVREPEPQPEPTKNEPTPEPQQQPEVKPETKPAPATKLEGKAFVFNLIDAKTKQPVVGEVQILEGPRATQYQAFRANESVLIKTPKNTDGVLVLSTVAPGYKGETRSFSYQTPNLPEGKVGSGEEYIIDLELERVTRGDYVEFNDVRFFANSVALQPESRNELDGLAALLKENPKYKIDIHAHCNGKQDREVNTHTEGADPFVLDPSKSKKVRLSAKRFTQQRGELVKSYLVSQGIETKRIAVTAEGGRVPIYPANSTLAGRNDRIEIQIKKGK